MGALRRVAVCTAAVLAVLMAGAGPASADRACGVVGRPFTDGGASVTVRTGALRCTTARGLYRRYWNRSVDAFTRSARFRYAGIRWTCRPTTNDFPYRWSCSGGGPSRNRFRVTARE
jgi:hypothetical protein